MQEAGIPVTYGYISDTHDKKTGATGCTSPGNALGPGDACSVAALKSYDNAFNTFFQRLAADGITPANTVFEISAEENDQFAGANVGRATQPTPAGCDGVTVEQYVLGARVHKQRHRRRWSRRLGGCLGAGGARRSGNAVRNASGGADTGASHRPAR